MTAKPQRASMIQAHILESGQRRIDVVEFLNIADVIGFDPRRVINRLRAAKR
jgi:hypothetical protein